MMSVSSTDNGLLTPGNAVLMFIDYQPAMLSCLADDDQKAVLDNVAMLANAATNLELPVVVTAVKAPGFDASILSGLAAALQGSAAIARTSMNAWDSGPVVAAVRGTARRNLVMSALWSDTCLVMPALQALADGYGVYAVEDASAGTSPRAHAVAIRRIEQAGGVSLTTVQFVLELMRDCAGCHHFTEVVTMIAKRGRQSKPREPLA